MIKETKDRRFWRLSRVVLDESLREFMRFKEPMKIINKTVIVIATDLTRKDDNVRFTTVPFKTFSC